MERVIHARLDSDTEEILEELRRRTGLTDSALVRQGLKALASLNLSPGHRMPVGVGEFESGIPDLGSSKEHLSDFGS